MEPEEQKPLVALGLLLAWLLALGLFLAGAGCTVVYAFFAFDSSTKSSPEVAILAILIMLGGLWLLVRSVIRGHRAQRSGKNGKELITYLLWLPLLAVFIWGGGCLFGVNAM